MTNRFAGLALAALTSMFALPAHAQSGNWKVDSDHSAARISVEDKTAAGSGITLLLGRAEVSGSLRLDNDNVSKSAVEFIIYPAGSGPAASQAGDPADPDAAQTTLLSFHSEQASWASDGRLKVTGLLTVTQIERQVELNANEAYSGPVYVDRVTSLATREESFILSIPSPNTPKSKTTDVSTSLRINREDFPELVYAVLSTNWPATAQDKNCEAPLTFSEDYSGTLCTGSEVIVPSDTRTVVAASEDYPGSQANLAEPGNFVTVALQLHLAQQSTQLSAKTGQ
jgi:polyisoprenoid-binding protein YceI